ncbi:MAG: hypothetical protein ACREXU_21990 [Gammaproteobacteria bacterium]
MVIDMNGTRLRTLGQLTASLEGTGEVEFERAGRDEDTTRTSMRCSKRCAYPRLKQADKGRVVCYLR